MSRLRYVWPPALVGAALLLGWELLVATRNIAPYLLPAPSRIGSELAKEPGLIGAAAGYTATTAVLGLALGVAAGVVAALAAGAVVAVRRLLSPLAAGLAAVPIVALTPILNNMFDITSRTPRVLVTAIVAFFPVFVNVTRGLVGVPAVQVQLMRSLDASAGTQLRVLRVPHAWPYLFAALTVAAPMAVIAALVAEYFGGPQEGLGSRIASSAANTAYGRAWAYVVAAVLTGLVFYLATLALERLTQPLTGRPAAG